MNTVIGIDLGSRTTKILTLTGGEIHHSEIFDTGHDPLPRIRQSLDKLEPAPVIATGYGRHLLREEIGARILTEIKACGKGARSLFPSARLVLDVGGQDCKVIALDEYGKVSDFEMNDRCAAGTGRFLELVSERLEITLDELGTHAERAVRPSVISNMCAVFAETEITGLMAQGESRENIVAGVQKAIASRTAAMAGSRIETPVVLTGGVALVSGMDTALAEALNQEIYVSSLPIFTGALGAALSAEDFS